MSDEKTRELREYYGWWYSQQEILLLSGRNDPRLEQKFLDEWDRTPPPLAQVRWDISHPDHHLWCDCGEGEE
jgi:hypothetical protein